MRSLLILMVFVGVCSSSVLPNTYEEPLSLPDYEETTHTKTISKRSVPWFLPVFFPPVIHIHNYITLQEPNMRCFPTQPNSPTTPPPPPTNATTVKPDLLNRMGNDNGTTETPSKCTWAIISCCSPDSENIRYNCFELLGCPGAFWGTNPCSRDVVRAAANTALKFYMSNENSLEEEQSTTS